MSELYHAEFRVQAAGDDPRTTGSIVVPVITRLFASLHATKRRHALDFALAFPEMREGTEASTPWLGRVIHVWSSTRKEIETLLEALQLPAGIRPHVAIGSIKTLPENFEGPWRAYVRYRVPSRKSRVEGSRQQRLEKSLSLPFFRVGSQSNGHPFSISVLPIETDNGREITATDSYGLSSLRSPLALPIVTSPCV